MNTRNILFICGGAFPDLEEIIKQRLNKKTSIGYNAELKDKYDKEKNILKRVTVEDIKKFGMIPEFIGRLPIIFTLEGLTKEMMVKILSETKSCWSWMRYSFALTREPWRRLPRRPWRKRQEPGRFGRLLRSLCWTSCMKCPRMIILAV